MAMSGTSGRNAMPTTSSSSAASPAAADSPAVSPAADLDEITDEPEFGLDAGLDRSVWLVKVPRFLSDRWAEAGGAASGVELGRLRITQDTLNNTSQVALHIPEAAWSANLPKTYNLRFTNMTPHQEYVFTEDSQGRAMELAGRVQHEAALNPPMTDDYRDIVRMRTETASKPKRTIVMMENREAMAESRRLLASSRDKWESGLTSSASLRKAAVAEVRAKTGSAPEKRERMARSDLRDTLFEQFSSYPYWNFKSLLERTQQPHAYLKEVLAEVCVLNKRGPYSNMYQLKPEFGGPGFVVSSSTAASAASSPYAGGSGGTNGAGPSSSSSQR